MIQKDKSLVIIAGPCSISEKNKDQLFEISNIKIRDKNGKKYKPIWGLRIVGLKSKTSMKSSGEGMGMDFKEYMHNVELMTSGRSVENFKIHPSVNIAKEVIEKTGLTVATEIMDPLVQLPIYEKHIPNGKLFIWNPATNQLGYPMHVMGIYANRNNWYIGIKNGKWFGDEFDGTNIMEKNWVGQTSFASKDKLFSLSERIAMIHRGVDIQNRGQFRNMPLHDSAERVKINSGMKMFFDPSHSLGKNLRDKIVEYTVKTMKLKTNENKYLYDGILIEVGDSETDTGQHITVKELEKLCKELSKFRDLIGPDQIL